MSNSDFKKLIEDYNLDYCKFLEAVYGEGMMSEGGGEAIAKMFEGVPIEQRKALDIGAGLGGVVNYLAKNFGMHVTGLEINPSMVEEANKRIPHDLKNQVYFQLYKDLSHLPFEDNQFDIVYSKGVLTHVKDKAPLFQEIARVLKTDGKFVINDWLSAVDGLWSDSVIKMAERENLTLYAVNIERYRQELLSSGFEIINERDDTQLYSHFNQYQVDWLKDPTNSDAFKLRFGEDSWQLAYEAYQLISDSMKNCELLVKNFVCSKR